MTTILATGQPVGVHLLLNVYHVPDTGLLSFLSRGRAVLDEIVRELNLQVVSQTGHQFPPIGYTYAYVLSESHFTIHTYPELQSCYLDLFCCHPHFDPLYAIQLIKRRFHTENVRYHIIQR